jgi:hypothetical protein
VILSARTLYFGICSSMREKISTSSVSELQRSNERNGMQNESLKIILLVYYFRFMTTMNNVDVDDDEMHKTESIMESGL